MIQRTALARPPHTTRPQSTATRSTPARRGTGLLRVAAVASLAALALTGCRQDATPINATPSATPSPTAPPMMQIVTPTPGAPLIAATPATGEEAPTEPDQPSGRPETYVVQAGDSLFSIAIKFQLDVQTLADANGISDPNMLQLGQVLTIPAP